MSNATSPPLATGSRIDGKYDVVRLIGEGGMGAVYEAQNSWTRARVAIKVLHPSLATSEEIAWRFLQEARSAAQLSHPNIIRILDMGRDPASEALYIVEEYLEGQNLRELLQARRRLPANDALQIVLPVMSALVAAHERGIVHRDVKPENIFLVKSDGGGVSPRLIDFGIAKVAENDGLGKTRAGTMMGTALYASPEQLRGDTTTDAQTDVWSIGVVMYECMAGRSPFDAATPGEVVMKVASQPVTALDTIVNLRPGIAAMVHRAIERDLGRRYPTMRAFYEAALACTANLSAPPSAAENANTMMANAVALPQTMFQDPAAIDPRMKTGAPSVPSAPSVSQPPATFAVQFTQPSASPMSAPGFAPQTGAPAHPVRPPTVPPPSGTPQLLPAGGSIARTSIATKAAVTASVIVVVLIVAAIAMHSSGAIVAGFKMANDTENLRTMFLRMRASAMAGDTTLARSLLPDAPRLGAALREPQVAGVAQAVLQATTTMDDAALLRGLTSSPDQTIAVVHGFTTEQLATQGSSGMLPDAMPRFAQLALRSGVTFYGIETLAPGQSSGLKFNVFYWDGRQWSLLMVPNDWIQAQPYTITAGTSLPEEQRCAAGNGIACANAGAAYERGTGVALDYAHAAALYNAACQRGIAAGCASVGLLYFDGRGVTRDQTRAAGLFNQGCNGNVAASCTALGVMYDQGVVLERDSDRAQRLYARGCELGDANGCRRVDR